MDVKRYNLNHVRSLPAYRYVPMDVKRYNNYVRSLPAVPIRYTDTAGGGGGGGGVSVCPSVTGGHRKRFDLEG